jgi:hypothetical protein
MKTPRFTAVAVLTFFFACAAGAQTPHHDRVGAARGGHGGSASIMVKINGNGIASILPTACSFQAGAGSANQPVCQFSAVTVPPGGTVTWALNGGPDAPKFVLSTAGALSTGANDIPVSQVSSTGVPIPYTIFVQANGP